MKHADTDLWFVQALTGFIMFFLGSIHLYTMISQASNINADAAADRFVTGNFWPMYLVLHLSVGLHLVVGLYRLAVKSGPFDGKNPRKTRRTLKIIRNALAIFYIVIGLFTFYEYMKIGYENRAHRDGSAPHTSWGLAGGDADRAATGVETGGGSSGVSSAPVEGGEAR
jgi:fumarate reductase subunit C